MGGLPCFKTLSTAEYDRRGRGDHDSTLQLKMKYREQELQNNNKMALGPPASRQFYACTLKQGVLRIPGQAH